MPARRILITGHTSGLGAGLAEEAVARGDRVFGLARRRLDRSGLRQVSVDLADFAAVPTAVDALLEGLDAEPCAGAGNGSAGHGPIRRIDLVILNAGVLGRIEPMPEASIDDMKAVFDVNVWAVKAVLDALIARRVELGQVVAISSGAAVLISRGWNAYAMSKAALNALMRLYAQELPQTHVCALAPGLIASPMLEHLLRGVDPEAYPAIGELRKAEAAGRVQTPQVAARAILDATDWLRTRPSGAFIDLREHTDPEAFAAIQARLDAVSSSATGG